MAGADRGDLSLPEFVDMLLRLDDSNALRAFLADAGKALPFLDVVQELKRRSDSLARDHPSEAHRIVAIAFAVAEFSDDPACAALAAWAEGNVYFLAGEYTRCQASYQAALRHYRAVGDQVATARLLTNLGATLTDQGRYTEAQACFDQARSLLEPLGPTRFLAILELNQVTSYFNYANRTVLGLGVSTEGDELGLSPGDSDDPKNWHHA